MNIKFRDVSSGIVEARAKIKILEGIYLNEVTIIRKNKGIFVEFPQKSFKGKDNKMHYLDIVSFEDEDLETLYKMEIKEAYNNWRKKNKKVLVYDPE